MKKRTIMMGGGLVTGIAATIAVNPLAQSLGSSPLISATPVAVTATATAAESASASAATPASTASASPSSGATTATASNGGTTSGAGSTTTASSTSSAGSTASATSSPTASATSSASSSSGTRTITGDAVSMRFGTVQVQITVSGSKVTGITVLEAPGGRNQQYTDYAVPILTQEVLSAQSTSVAIVSGATFVSDAFLQSVASAMQQI